MQQKLAKSRRRQAGQTLLELVAASTIIAVALVPALRIMRDSVRVGRDTETANLLATLSASKLEEHLALTAANWTTTTTAGNFTPEGYPLVKFQVAKSDAVSDGGIPGVLMSVTSTVWEDDDNDGGWDSGELRSVFASKLALSIAYSREASGT
jgi:Tfp pilus assembly protein PilE